MDFLKKHYEKIILGIVLVAMAGGAAFLPIMISRERNDLKEKSDAIINRPVKALPPLDLHEAEAALARASTPLTMDLASSNRVFNSMPWQKRMSDGMVIKNVEGNTGPSAVIATNPVPLNTIISLDSVTTTDTGSRYVISVERQAATSVTARRKKQFYASLNAKNEAFVIREVKGPPESPTELVLELNDTGEKVAISREKNFQRVDGYLADLRYEPEKKIWNQRRVGDSIRLAGEDYNIVAINKNEVVLSAKSNNKKTLIRFGANS
ncbi:MAG: hypothetical protein EPO07_08905 [Verrucomicrobia bacterium]|nr:MAG: hypothetical protein EPO07_08905 [Verrucomicrobiota bacterium]